MEECEERAEWRAFDAGERRYILARLHGLLNPVGGDPQVVTYLLDGDYYLVLAEARRLLPKSGALWELQAFMGHATAVAVRDVMWGQLQSFSAFRFLHERTLGARSRPYLPMMFLSAVASPGVADKFRLKYLERVTLADVCLDSIETGECCFIPEIADDIPSRIPPPATLSPP